MNACRFYYPQIQLKPEKLNAYISSNRAKKVCFTLVLNTFSNISTSSTNSFLVQSGVSNIRGLLIMPFLAGISNGAIAGGTGGAGGSGVMTFLQIYLLLILPL